MWFDPCFNVPLPVDPEFVCSFVTCFFSEWGFTFPDLIRPPAVSFFVPGCIIFFLLWFYRTGWRGFDYWPYIVPVFVFCIVLPAICPAFDTTEHGLKSGLGVVAKYAGSTDRAGLVEPEVPALDLRWLACCFRNGNLALDLGLVLTPFPALGPGLVIGTHGLEESLGRYLAFLGQVCRIPQEASVHIDSTVIALTDHVLPDRLSALLADAGLRIHTREQAEFFHIKLAVRICPQKLADNGPEAFFLELDTWEQAFRFALFPPVV